MTTTNLLNMKVSIFGRALQTLFSILTGLIFSVALWFAAIIAWILTVISSLLIGGDYILMLFTIFYIVILIFSPFFPIRFILKTYSKSKIFQQAWVSVVDSVVETIQRGEKAQAELRRYIEAVKPKLDLENEEYINDKNGNYPLPSFSDTYGIALKLIVVILFIGILVTCLILVFIHIVQELDFRHLNKKFVKVALFTISSIGSILFMFFRSENFNTLADKVSFFTSTSVFPNGLLDYLWD